MWYNIYVRSLFTLSKKKGIFIMQKKIFIRKFKQADLIINDKVEALCLYFFDDELEQDLCDMVCRFKAMGYNLKTIQLEPHEVKIIKKKTDEGLWQMLLRKYFMEAGSFWFDEETQVTEERVKVSFEYADGEQKPTSKANLRIA